MRPVIRLTVTLAVSLAGVALWAQPAAANTVSTVGGDPTPIFSAWGSHRIGWLSSQGRDG
jgi:hypothetical protein